MDNQKSPVYYINMFVEYLTTLITALKEFFEKFKKEEE